MLGKQSAAIKTRALFRKRQSLGLNTWPLAFGFSHPSDRDGDEGKGGGREKTTEKEKKNEFS